MPHALRIDTVELDDIDGRLVAHRDRPAAASLHRLADDEVAVVVRPGTRRDGTPVAGGIDVLGRGEGARYRVRDLTFEIVWRPGTAARVARDQERCRCCAEVLDAGTTIASCPCGAVFCSECETVRVACPECRAAPVAAEGRR